MRRRPISTLFPVTACRAVVVRRVPSRRIRLAQRCRPSSNTVFSPFPGRFCPFIATSTRKKACTSRRLANRLAQLPFKNGENGGNGRPVRGARPRRPSATRHTALPAAHRQLAQLALPRYPLTEQPAGARLGDARKGVGVILGLRDSEACNADAIGSQAVPPALGLPGLFGTPGAFDKADGREAIGAVPPSYACAGSPRISEGNIQTAKRRLPTRPSPNRVMLPFGS
jgi:hypothetical protein